GENHGGDYGRALAQKIAPHERIRITGYTDAAAFEAWLRAADTAIQLRGVTRGETSRTALDCLAYGLPLIVNASGSLAELPGAAVMRVPADFADAELADAMTALARDAGLRERLGERARKHIAQRHDPVVIAAAYRDAIERFAHESRGARYAQAVRDVAAIEVTPDARPGDWRAAAQSIALLLRRPPARQLLVDVSILARQDLRTGIERVVRAVLLELLERAPAGWRVEPVVAGRECYRYGRQFTASWLGVPGSVGDDAPIEVAAGDVFFGLDWAANIVPDEEPVLQRYRTLGVSVVFLVHDLLPILRPDFYPVGIDAMHATWLSTVSRVADGVFCVSNSVIDDLVAWLDQHGANRESALGLAVLPLASDISRSVPTHGVPPDAAALRTEIARRKSVLMVGTLEARKAHAQALAGFEQLWRSGVDVNLVVAGKQGWMVDDLASRMRAHPEMGRRLFWFESASDEWLDALYADADVLLAPSLGEGFGLPLIEAARHGVPIIARDLPVFREVAGAHAMYFSGTSPADIASAIVDWQRAGETGDVPDSSRIAYRDWRASVDRLLDVIIEGRWERAWRPPGHASGKPVAMRQIDFSRAWLPSAVRAIKGLSGREHWGRWSDADIHPHVEISFRDPLPASGSLALTARAFGPNVGQPIRVRIGRHETELRFDAHDTTAVASYALGQAPQLLEIVPPHPTQPCTLGDSQDPRRLGIGLVRLTIQASATSEA
ncbi:MAG TPA: glycosyltransferase, partial [Casimicrobiaceae bacterium]|nr:glycosyltransferase [Casimicrobiaceae bacterium]